MHKKQKMTQCLLFADETPAPTGNSAVASNLANCYHLYLAVQKCFEMEQKDKVFIETFGDITLNNDSQIEVKHYSGNLTDAHPNLWNTLKNWMDDSFDHSSYSSLILHTTQKFGSNASIVCLNDLSLDEKLQVLKKIYRARQDDFETSRKNEEQKEKSKKTNKPQVLKLQEKIFDPSKSDKLKSILDKFFIDANNPKLPDLFDKICEIHLKGVDPDHHSIILDSLVGFVIKAKESHSPWVITYDEFTNTFKELTQFASTKKIYFPRITTQPAQYSPEEHSELFFVQKIKEIEFEKVIPTAFAEYDYALQTITDELSSYSVPKVRHDNFFNELEKHLERTYLRAQLLCSDDVIKESQRYYCDRTIEESLEFEGFSNRPSIEFKNGVIHMLLDSKDLKWKLKE